MQFISALESNIVTESDSHVRGKVAVNLRHLLIALRPLNMYWINHTLVQNNTNYMINVNHTRLYNHI